MGATSRAMPSRAALRSCSVLGYTGDFQEVSYTVPETLSLQLCCDLHLLLGILTVLECCERACLGDTTCKSGIQVGIPSAVAISLFSSSRQILQAINSGATDLLLHLLASLAQTNSGPRDLDTCLTPSAAVHLPCKLGSGKCSCLRWMMWSVQRDRALFNTAIS